MKSFDKNSANNYMLNYIIIDSLSCVDENFPAKIKKKTKTTFDMSV